jgi:hypothetical protein
LRKAFGFPAFLVVMNMSDEDGINFHLQISNDVAPRAYVRYYIPGSDIRKSFESSSDNQINLIEKYKFNTPLLTKNVYLKSRDCLILTWPSSD